MPDGNNPRELFNEKLALMLRTELSVATRASRELYIYLGEADKIASLRKQLPEQAPLLYFHPANSKTIESDDWTLTHPFEKDFREFILIAVSCFQPESINCARSETTDIFGEEELLLIKEAADCALRDTNNERSLRLPRLRASLQNLPRILSGEKLTFKKLSSSAPAIVCGAGPSLSSQLPLIKKLSKKALIIVSGRLGKTFLDNGITPDFMVHIDPELEADASLPEMPDSTLLAVPGSSPGVTSKFKKIIWAKGDSLFFNRFLQDNNIVLHDMELSMTSTVTAIDLAVKTGCQDIMLAGCDLCLSKDGASHVGTYQMSNYQGKLIEIDGNNGKVATLKEFDILRIAIENYLESAKNSGATFYNCALDGAAIKNSKIMSLDDFSSQCASPEINKDLIKDWDITYNAVDFNKIKNLLKEYIDFTNEKIKCLEDIGKQKDNPMIVSALNKGLAMLENKTIEISGNDEIIHFIEAANETLEDIYPITQTNALKRAKFTLNLCKDFLVDLEWNGIPENRPHTRRFNSLKNSAIDLVEKNNPEYASALKKKAFDKEEDDCVFLLKGIDIPSIALNGQKLPDYEETAREEIEVFSTQNCFDPSRNATCLINPGNWHCAVAFAKKYPNADLIVIDPNPGLFSKLIKYSWFFRAFNENTLIVGIHEKLPGWKNICMDRIERLKSDGKNIVFFKPSSTWKMPETQKLVMRHSLFRR